MLSRGESLLSILLVLGTERKYIHNLNNNKKNDSIVTTRAAAIVIIAVVAGAIDMLSSST
jgi:hypothetical protein